MKRKKSSQPAQHRDESGRPVRRPCHTLEIETRDIVDEVEVVDAVERDLVCGVY